MTGKSTLRKALQSAASPVLWIAALFGSAGRLDWARGWIAAALLVIGMTAVGAVVQRFNAGLMEARSQWRRQDTKRFDRVFLCLLLPLTILQPAVAGLDAERFRWSTAPLEAAYAGAAILILSMAVMAWSMAVNRFAEPTVRIQSDRGHSVVSSGPYRFVRHPMYVGAILMYLAIPLVLGSLWALVPGGVIAALFIWRTALEDGTLRRELAGYDEYEARTRYRLLPGLW